jgi:hypothetical protein
VKAEDGKPICQPVTRDAAQRHKLMETRAHIAGAEIMVEIGLNVKTAVSRMPTSRRAANVCKGKLARGENAANELYQSSWVRPG